ncbi:MAG: hypothetical protein KKB37_10885 [Alphaproteobacteria bacterium]|nr:hypothetical protein [Alphaproteobacteria bacterium]
MLDWLASHDRLVGLALDLAMLVVWLVYLQFFVASYQRQRRSLILISLAAEAGLSTRCLLGNMSTQPIFVMSIKIRLSAPGRCPVSASVTEMEREGTQAADGARTRQGPVQPGEMRDFGTVGELLRRVFDDPAGNDLLNSSRCVDMEISIIAEYTSESLPVAAQRQFVLSNGDGWKIRPKTAATHQIRSYRERRKLSTSILEDSREQQQRF